MNPTFVGFRQFYAEQACGSFKITLVYPLRVGVRNEQAQRQIHRVSKRFDHIRQSSPVTFASLRWPDVKLLNVKISVSFRAKCPTESIRRLRVDDFSGMNT